MLPFPPLRIPPTARPRHCFLLLLLLLWRHLLGVACVLFELLYIYIWHTLPQSRSHFVWQVCRKSMRQPGLSSHKPRGNKGAALSRPCLGGWMVGGGGGKGKVRAARFKRLPASFGPGFFFVCCCIFRLPTSRPCFKCHFGLCAPVTRGNLN